MKGGFILKRITIKKVFSIILLLTLLVPFNSCSLLPIFGETTIIQDDNGIITLVVSDKACGIAIEEVDGPPEGSLGKVFDISPEGTVFQPWASLTIKYDPDDLQNIDGDDLAIARLWDDIWIPLSTSHNKNEQTLTTSVAGLGTFGVVSIADEEKVSAAEILSIAEELYSTLEDDGDIEKLIEDILIRFAPLLNLEEELDLALQLVDEGVPFFTTIHPEALAEGFKKSFLVTVDSFFEGLNDGSIEKSGSLGYVSPDAMEQFYDQYLDGKDYLLEADVLPFLITALAQARGEENFQNTYWQDGFLDPLQYTLLTYAFHYAAVDRPEITTARIWRPITPSVKKVIKKGVSGVVGGILGVPIGPKDAAKATIVASIVLNSYNVDLAVTPDRIWRRRPEAPEAVPYKSDVTVLVSFDFIPRNRSVETFLDVIADGLPEIGPAKDIDIQWSLEEPVVCRILFPPAGNKLKDHGSLNPQDTRTDGDGRARAEYVTVDDIPLSERDSVAVDMGFVYVYLGRLLGWGTRTMEAIVTTLNPIPTMDMSLLSVRYHNPGTPPNYPGPTIYQKWGPTLNPLWFEL